MRPTNSVIDTYLTTGRPKIIWDLRWEFYRGLFIFKYHLNNIYLFLFNFKSIINSYLLIWLIHPKWANDNYYISFTNWHITNKRKVIPTFILLYYLSNIDHILVISVCKFFFPKICIGFSIFHTYFFFFWWRKCYSYYKFYYKKLTN